MEDIDSNIDGLFLLRRRVANARFVMHFVCLVRGEH